MSSLPPVEPPNLRRNRRGQAQNDNYDPNYPPPADPRYPPQQPANYPPPGASNYPPLGAAPNRNDPRYEPSYPPPPPDTYPPAAPDYYSGGGTVDLDDPAFGAPARRPRAAEPPRSTLDPVGTPDLRRERPSRNIPSDAPITTGARDLRSPRGGGMGSLLSERQVESLAWGSVVMMLGISLILAVTGSYQFLRVAFPLIAGLILLVSSLYQQVVMGWHVSKLTWLVTILLLSYTITLELADDNEGFFRWIIYFIGTLVILLGFIRLLQVFQEQRTR